MATVLDSELGLHSKINRLREVDNAISAACLVREYVCLALVIGGAVAWSEARRSLGWAWWADVPVFALAILMVGALQHRLAGLGHEAAHYLLFRNKFLNDLAGDLLCLFPVWSTVHFYRLSHQAHHQFTNDPDRDPNVVTTGEGKGVDDFPMPRGKFIWLYYFRLFSAPRALFRYVIDYARLNMVGLSATAYQRGADGQPLPRPRTAFRLGVAYLAGFIAVQWFLTTTGRAWWLVPAGFVGVGLAVLVGRLLPDTAFFQSPLKRQPYSSRFAGVLRLAYMTALLVVLGLLRDQTGGRSTLYFALLWIAPSLLVFSFLLLLRDVYQHANADDGRYTNTRVFYPDPITRWAILMYGQDMHLPHHLYPLVPHHRLAELHALLKQERPDYEAEAVEVHGVFGHRAHGQPNLLDVMAEPRIHG